MRGYTLNAEQNVRVWELSSSSVDEYAQLGVIQLLNTIKPAGFDLDEEMPSLGGSILKDHNSLDHMKIMIARRKVVALVDTGASLYFMSKNLAKQMPLHISKALVEY